MHTRGFRRDMFGLLFTSHAVHVPEFTGHYDLVGYCNLAAAGP
jgi:hypothetical protein